MPFALGHRDLIKNGRLLCAPLQRPFRGDAFSLIMRCPFHQISAKNLHEVHPDSFVSLTLFVLVYETIRFQHRLLEFHFNNAGFDFSPKSSFEGADVKISVITRDPHFI